MDGIVINRVWAEIFSPSMPSIFPIVEFHDLDNNTVYEGVYNNFIEQGTYFVAIYATDTQGITSSPVHTTIRKLTEGDDYEEDNTFEQARIIIINDTDPQIHNFHEPGDEDWIQFYARSEMAFKFEANNLSEISDAVIEVYDTDGITLLKRTENKSTAGKKETLQWKCPQNGIYYARIQNLNPNLFGDNVKYELKAYIVTASLPGHIEGLITNFVTGEPIIKAKIWTPQSSPTTALSRPTMGGYTIVQEAGTTTVTIEADGYKTKVIEEVRVMEGENIILNVRLIPIGDVSGDGGIDLKDAIITLQIMVRTDMTGLIQWADEYTASEIDVNGDNRIGFEEAIYIIQKITMY